MYVFPKTGRNIALYFYVVFVFNFHLADYTNKLSFGFNY